MAEFGRFYGGYGATYTVFVHVFVSVSMETCILTIAPNQDRLRGSTSYLKLKACVAIGLNAILTLP